MKCTYAKPITFRQSSENSSYGPFVFLSFQAGLDLLSVGHMLADVVAIIGKLSQQQNAVAIFSRKKSLISLSRSLGMFA